MSRWAVVLAGGSGTRFWPLSTSRSPKQFLPLATEIPLLRQAVDRLDGLVPPERVLVVTGAALRDGTRSLLPQVPPGNVLAEPRPASTGPALAWATATAAARDPGATLLALHADWAVRDDAAFRQTAARALEVAESQDVLVTVGVVPTRPEIGYGYIQPGDVLEGDARRVARFIEKPDEATAVRLIAGGALWNSGLFAWTAKRFVQETQDCAPEIAPHLPLLARGDVDGYFAAVRPIAVDVSHFERSAHVAVVPGRFPWDDVGTWAALGRVRGHDAAGNTLVGDVVTVESTNSIAWGDGPVVLYGVDGLVVVRANNIVLVTTPERAPHLKELLERIPARLKDPA